MKRKLIGALMALAAFAAFVVAPSIASAATATTITHPTGTVLATGTKVEGTGIITSVFKAGLSTVSCSTSTLTGTLEANSNTESKGTISTATFSGTGAGEDCTSNLFSGAAVKVTTGVTNGTPYCMFTQSTNNADEVKIRGGGCGEATRKIAFTFDFTGFAECKYERTTTTGPIIGEYLTDTGASPSELIINVKPNTNSEFAPTSGNPIGCPGNGNLEMSLTMETDGVTNSPLYAS